MLVERDLDVMNVDVVGKAYDIAANYLRRSGTIEDSPAVNEQLLEIVVRIFHGGSRDRIRIANRAIAQFEAALGA